MFVLPRLPLKALGAVSLLSLAACGQPQQQQGGPPPPPAVTVAKPQPRTITDYDEYVGRFVAMDEVNVHARVSGYLSEIQFTDGQLVKKGDPLFTLDQRPFKIALDQAKANLAQAQANLDYAQTDLERAKTLLQDRNSTAISKQTFDQRTQTERTAAATLQAQEAAVASAQLDLEFTQLTAPISGRIGDRRVSVGNYVIGASAGTPTLLAVIVSQDPIRFEFTFDEGSLLRYKNSGTGANDGAPVDLKLLDEKTFAHHGKMDFLNNVVDTATGTIRGRAVFANPDGLFKPGMFARIRVAASKPYEALTVPDTAIGTEQVRKFVYVVGPENTIAMKFVELGPVVDGRRAVKSGLTADDVVVVNGLMRVRPGVKVTPQEEKPAAPAPAGAQNGNAAAPAK
ncbi:efflux RND transporter periplasmic adaptor subunit [Azorhizobium caulinodans]|nr:efflux RND transporter periplasmic adaptor subunit [Azorhizobium caulinodans]